MRHIAPLPEQTIHPDRSPAPILSYQGSKDELPFQCAAQQDHPGCTGPALDQQSSCPL